LIAVLLRDFLLPVVQSGLLDSGKNAVLATSFVRRLVERWTAPALRTALINFLLGVCCFQIAEVLHIQINQLYSVCLFVLSSE
jgi:hypothetical protein